MSENDDKIVQPPDNDQIAQKPTKKRKTAHAKTKSDKDLATERREPWVSIISLDVDPDDLHQGSFELDWNEFFIARLVKAGYMMSKDDTDADIVDRWFQNVCRHVVMETWEQEQAMNPQPRFTHRRDIGGGRSEVS